MRSRLLICVLGLGTTLCVSCTTHETTPVAHARGQDGSTNHLKRHCVGSRRGSATHHPLGTRDFRHNGTGSSGTKPGAAVCRECTRPRPTRPGAPASSSHCHRPRPGPCAAAGSTSSACAGTCLSADAQAARISRAGSPTTAKDSNSNPVTARGTGRYRSDP